MLQVLDVADDTISIRSLDWDRDRFDIEFGLQEGTTYNSFLIFGDKTCLVDASHEKFRELYMKTLKQQLAERGRTLDYVVVSHTEPDHSGAEPHRGPQRNFLFCLLCTAQIEHALQRSASVACKA